MRLGKVEFFPGIPQNIDFSKLTDLGSNQDVARPTESVILAECARIGLQITTNSNQGSINNYRITGQPLEQTKIK